jgi:short-subunit dehydrogenase
LDFLEKYGPWALVAGAAEGIGAAFSELLAQKGMNLLLVDMSEERLALSGSRLRQEYKVETREIVVDLVREDSWKICLAASETVGCRLMVYVAAFSKIKPFLASTQDEIDRYINVNARTPLKLIHGFAGHLVSENKSGGIILVSSLAGLLGPPLVAPYAATKAFLIRLAESLSGEFSEVSVDITVCCAGITKTPAYVANTPERTQRKFRAADPSLVAGCAIKNLGKRTVCIPGWKNRFSIFILLRILPRSLAVKIMAKTMKKMY